MELYNRLCTITKQENVMKDEPMKKHTTFRIGGPADYFVTPESKEEIQAIVELCKKEEIPYSLIGNGSNLLVGDKGYRGVILQIFKKMNQIRVEENKIYAGAGALLSKIAATALSESLTGFEFAAGIPGTLGGAVRMNAGAYGGEMKQVLESVEVMTADGEFLTIPVEEMGLAYRTSVVEQKNYIVLEAVISLEKGNPEKIKEVMDDLKEKRVTKQPLEYASAGSTFKRPEGYFAGKLIEDAGLRGFRVGDAQVSEKHCGFVINRGNASAAEVMELMRQVEDRVEENSGVRLEAEVRRIGEF
ncbi:UDP-N-acetylmuramate dehydrogenase [Mediterraneibacter faecis]|uniref:UDP-N-acetylmuramate dehydrogenase n=1 Tax=Mediterraneibacter faecis TaxID=592978 RepID=UPI001D017C64|nr:UDP-N-acetylmuramate dehydrogenase [Mediterraneibacter faecis]MCB5569821.1 UDP-N-acetylmuramate dehydrogenase [Mediterraneibacter faecis]MCB5572784.1 UDP-N-acetylmuramate dehydrogenase [Mediterraneibacter faecis]MCB5739374.1 UDP-N-acetylmuramate dehydrogenase [Mediterraneibacter faecis]MCB5750466.1 UDP-N-acetylmuramate dehydrogenase [Mediterraneibacter faecis]